MSVSSVGRNDPCPCGSGKKYKKCCISKEEIHREASGQASGQAPPGLHEAPIDQSGNRALDAIEARRYDEAEELCRKLLEQYPDQLDGHDRFGMLREAQGRFQEAAHHYGQAVAMIEKSPEGYDREVVADFRRRRENALSKTKSSV